MKVISFLYLLFLVSCASEPKKNKDPIREALKTKNDEFRECYLESDSYPGRRSQTTGAVKVSFMIDTTGKLNDEKIAETTFKDPNFHACILGMMRTINFPAPKDPVYANESINFYPAF